MNIYYFPFESRVNPYVERSKSILTKIGYTPLKIKLKKFFYSEKLAEVVVLNWLEGWHISNSGKFRWRGGVEQFLILCWISSHNKKIIWVKHNHSEHDASVFCAVYAKVIRFYLERVSEQVIVHDEIFAKRCLAEYVPHPLYIANKPVNKTLLDDVDVKYLVVGRIMRYKNVDKLIKRWPIGTPLCIAGHCPDNNYYQELSELINGDNKNITIINKYLSQDEMASLLTKSKVVVVANEDESCIVSGSEYLALSYGLCVFKPFSSSSGSVNSYVFNAGGEDILKSLSALDDLLKVTKKTDVTNYMNQFYSDECIGQRFARILSNF